MVSGFVSVIFKLTDYRPGLILIIFLDLEDCEILLGHKMPPGWED